MTKKAFTKQIQQKTKEYRSKFDIFIFIFNKIKYNHNR